MVRKSTIHRNPIGSQSEALQRQRSRQSLRRHIMNAEKVGLTMNTDSLVELNPKLGEVSHTTRVAYAKFMTTKVKKELQFEDDSKVRIENEKIRARESKAFNKFKEKAGILKKTAEKVLDETSQASSAPKAAVSETPAVVDQPKDFRSRTPIEETDEDHQTPEQASTPENVLAKPGDQASPSPTPTEEPASAKTIGPNGQIASPKAESPVVESKPATPVPKSPTPNPSQTEEGELSENTLNHAKSISFLADEDDEDEKEEKPSETTKKASKSNLDVPSSSNRPISPAPKSIHSDKGKSKITGKTLTGWI